MKGGIPLKKDPIKREIVYSFIRLPKREKIITQIPNLIGKSFDVIKIDKPLQQSFLSIPQEVDGDTQYLTSNPQQELKKNLNQILIPGTVTQLAGCETESIEIVSIPRVFNPKPIPSSIDSTKLDRFNLPKNRLSSQHNSSSTRLEQINSTIRLIQQRKESYIANQNSAKLASNNYENINQKQGGISIHDYGLSVSIKFLESQSRRQYPNNKQEDDISKGYFSSNKNIKNEADLGKISQELSNSQRLILENNVLLSDPSGSMNKTKEQKEKVFMTQREKKTFSLTDSCSNGQELIPNPQFTKEYMNHLRSKSDLNLQELDIINTVQRQKQQQEQMNSPSLKLPSLPYIVPSKQIPIKNSHSQLSLSSKSLFKGKANFNRVPYLENHRIDENSLINRTLIVSSVKQELKKKPMRDISVQSTYEDHNFTTNQSFGMNDSSKNQFNSISSKNIHTDYGSQQQKSWGDFEKGFGLKIQRHLKFSNSSSSSDSIRFLNQRNNIQSIGHKAENFGYYFARNSGMKVGDHHHLPQHQQQQQQRYIQRVELTSLPEDVYASDTRRSFNSNNMDDGDHKDSYELETYVSENRHIE